MVLMSTAAKRSLPKQPNPMSSHFPNITRIAYLRSVFPTARFVLWARDPRAACLSTHKWHRMPINTLMHHWSTAYLSAINALQDDCTIVRYEDFCADPVGTAASVAAFCGVNQRKIQLEPGKRFAAIVNSNDAYVKEFPAQFSTRASLRAWELFGYKI